MAIQKNTKITEFALEMQEKKAILNKIRLVDENAKPKESFFLLENENSSAELEELYIDKDTLYVIATMNDKETQQQMGYVRLEIPLNQKFLIDVISYTLKKTNKLKTIIENL